jgi:hypothetical protein
VTHLGVLRIGVMQNLGLLGTMRLHGGNFLSAWVNISSWVQGEGVESGLGVSKNSSFST